MGDSAGQDTEALEFLGMQQLSLKFDAFGLGRYLLGDVPSDLDNLDDLSVFVPDRHRPQLEAAAD